MANNVRAGVAYVDVRLGSIEKFKNQLMAQVTAAVKEAEKRVQKTAQNSTRQTSSMMSNIAGGMVKAFNAVPAGIQKVKSGLDSLSRSVGLASFQMQNFGMIATVAFTAPAAAAVTLGTIIGIKTAAQIEQATAGLKAMLPAGYNVEALIKRLQKLAIDSPIFDSSDVITFTQRMVASGLAIKDVEKFLKSFGNIALTVNADISKIPFALEALVQMVGKGTVSMEELRLQLGDALPGAMKIVSDALGVTTKELFEMVKAGELTGKELVAALTKLGGTKKYLDGAALGAETMAAKWQKLKEQVQAQLGDIFLRNADKIKKALDRLGPTFDKLIKLSEPLFKKIVEGFEKMVEGLEKLVNWYKDLDPEQKDFVNKLALIVVAIGPAVIALGSLLASVAGVAAGLSLIATPAGGATTAVGILAGAVWGLYKNNEDFRENLKDVKKSLEENLIKPMEGPAKKSIDDVKKSWQELMAVFGGGDTEKSMRNMKILGYTFAILASIIAAPWAIAVGIIRGAVASIGKIIEGFKNMTMGWIQFFNGIMDLFIGILTLDFERMKNGVINIWNGMWRAIISSGSNWIDAIIEFVKGLVTGIWDFFKWLWDVLVGHSIIPDIVNDTLAWFRKLVDGIKGFFSRIGGWFRGFYGTYIEPFISKVKGGIDKVLDVIGSIPGKIKKAFSGASSWLWDAGKNIVEGLVGGVRSMGGYLKSSILSLIPAPVRGAVEGALGIDSPSKVFAEIGRYVVLGFVKGIESTSNILDIAMNAFSVPTLATSGAMIDSREFSPLPRAALNIENYYANENSDPRREAENWYFITTSRGGEM